MPLLASISSAPLDVGSYETPNAAQEFAPASEAFKRGEHDKALALLEAVVRQRPELPPARFLLAKLFLANNQTPQARLLLEQAAAESPGEPDVHLVFGHLAIKEGRLTDAQLHFEKAASLAAKKSWNADRKAQCDTLCHAGLASIAEARGDWESARVQLSALLKLDPKQALYRQRLGRAQFHLDDVQVAIKELQQASADDKSLEPAPVFLARLYSRSGNSSKAEEWLKQATNHSPRDYRSHLAFASWLLEQDRVAEAEVSAVTALELAPEKRDVLYMNGTVACFLRQYPRAEEYFARLHAEYPADLEIANQFALCLTEQEDTAKQERALQLALSNLRQKPDSRQLYATLGWCYYQCGMLNDARQALERAISGGQGPAITGYYLARVMDELGHQDQVGPLLQAASKAQAPFLYRAEVNAWLASRTPAGE
jgi:tetratricopeptide (TPR) repeat protein